MKAFCPNCGSENEGMPGGRVTCRTCTASFEVPRERATQAPVEAKPAIEPTFIKPPTSAPPPPSVVKPPPSLTGAPPSSNAPFPTGYRGPPPAGFGGLGSALSGTGELNQLAVISVVLGVVCCIPFASIGAIVTGVMARNQIEASRGAQRGTELATIGIVLGGLSFLMSFASIVFSLLGKLR